MIYSCASSRPRSHITVTVRRHRRDLVLIKREPRVVVAPQEVAKKWTYVCKRFVYMCLFIHADPCRITSRSVIFLNGKNTKLNHPTTSTTFFPSNFFFSIMIGVPNHLIGQNSNFAKCARNRHFFAAFFLLPPQEGAHAVWTCMLCEQNLDFEVITHR